MDSGFKPLGEVWRSEKLSTGAGYHLGRGKSPEHLLQLRDFEMPQSGFGVEFTQLISWSEKYSEIAKAPTGNLEVYSARNEKIYLAPLVIIPQTPGEIRTAPKACISELVNLAYSQSYYGYSSHGHSHAELLSNLVYIVAHSRLWSHYALMRSSRIGASFRTFIKEDFDSFPFPNPNQMTRAQKEEALRLASNLLKSRSDTLKELDQFVFNLYGLSASESEIVEDTVEFFSQYRSTRLPAESPPTTSELSSFAKSMQDSLQPFFKVVQQEIRVAVVQKSVGDWIPPWRFITVLAHNDDFRPTSEFLALLMRKATETTASRVVMRVPGGGLIMGLLNQRRFWTKSRSRLCALHLSNEHLEYEFPLTTP